ncbi:MAG: tetratricopeptide repeat protein [Caulobacteraceae bacterium]
MTLSPARRTRRFSHETALRPDADRRRLLALAGAAALTALAPRALAQPAPDPGLQAQIDALYTAWERTNYEMSDQLARGNESAAAAARAGALARKYPRRSEPLVLQAMLLLVEADTKRDMRGLNLAKMAKHLLDEAERIDPNAFGDGSIYTLQGSLYAAVPGFPLGFGDKGKARRYLRQALAVNPDGLDPNYFYGDLLYHEGRYAEAEQVLNHALAAPPRPGKEVADRGRKREASDLLVYVRKKAARKG